MGYHVEVNALVRIPNDFDLSTLKVGKDYGVVNERERITPLHIALLMIDKDWNFLGYCAVNSAVVKDLKTVYQLKVISLFTPEEQKLYRDKFLYAAGITGELKK